MMGKSTFDQLDEVIDKQIVKLEANRQKLAALDESVKFSKSQYLELLDAYIGTEKLLREMRHMYRELSGL